LEAFAASRPDLIIDTDRIPFAVDFIEARYPLHWLGYGYNTASPRARVFRPLRGGISVSNERLPIYGTLGGCVLDRDDRTPMLLSNWHVLVGSAYIQRRIRVLQPAYGDGGYAGYSVAYLDRDAMDDGFDAAVAPLLPGQTMLNEQLGIGAITGAAMPELDMRVTKSGRASGVTEGIVDGIEGEYPMRYGGFPHSIRHVYRIVPRTAGREISRGGDSGSWWLHSGSRNAVALHFAGSDDPETALAMAMPPVLDALSVDIATRTAQAPQANASRRLATG
jgi:endonuclease G